MVSAESDTVQPYHQRKRIWKSAQNRNKLKKRITRGPENNQLTVKKNAKIILKNKRDGITNVFSQL
jgi:hypothetical protein